MSSFLSKYSRVNGQKIDWCEFAFLFLMLSVIFDITTTIAGLELGYVEGNYIPATLFANGMEPVWFVGYMFSFMVLTGIMWYVSERKTVLAKYAFLVCFIPALLPFSAGVNNLTIIFGF